ncbi:MAG: right-handed parallel beta-helix repeat-containing protein [Bacteroidetes bacterium]|nr:right-handed parallel beta-helix repeat-containing protein [Bacteroidota bacterium]
MRTIKFLRLGLITVLAFSSGLSAQEQRGYYDAPYIRYEADQGTLTNATMAMMSFNQKDLQSEASEQVCVDLSAVGASVEWKLKKEADGLVVRFSVPDEKSGEVEVYADGKLVGTLKLTSYWSWEFLTLNGNMNNVAVKNENPKMRFDEVRLKLPAKIAAGGKLKLLRKTGDIHIDFVELEAVPDAVQPAANDLVYKGDGSDLQVFIDNQGGGKSIYLPTGTYNVNRELYFGVPGTKLKGAGMWYSNVNFTSEDYLHGGLRANAKDISFMDLALTTTRNSRSSSYKGINGVFTSGSVIKNLWVEHFECGAWIAMYNVGDVAFADGFTVTNCRFRNNYADGINLCKGTRNATVEHCNFRNNGDDDMAIWSADGMECSNNTFAYSTAENGWRSAGCSIYGGMNNKAHHLIIRDHVEAGLRVNNNYPGVGFNEKGMHEFSNITVIRCGTFNDLFYGMVGAIDIVCNSIAGTKVQNVKFSNIDIIDAKDNAIIMNKCGGKGFYNFVFENITIDGTGREYPYNNEQKRDWPRGFGLLYAQNPAGNGTICNMVTKNRGGSAVVDIDEYGIGSFTMTEVKDCVQVK